MPRPSILPLLALGLATVAPAQDQKIPDDGPEILRTGSGLRYSVLKPGEGKHPGPGDRVRFHYSGWMAKTEVLFETSRRGEPKEMILGVAMPKVWVEAMQLMRPGARFKVFAPSDLCYGKHGSPGKPPQVPPVPPDTDVILEFELLSASKAITLPEFRLPVLARQKKSDSGLRYEILTPGADAPTPLSKGRYTVEFAQFNERGQLVVTSRHPEVADMVGRLDGKLDGPEFLAEAIAMLTPGRRMRFEVPPSLCYGAQDRGYLLPPNSLTVWELELLDLQPAPQPRPAPEFKRLDLRAARATKSGLRYEVVREGKGPRPGPTARVEVHYAGWLSGGKRFFESYTGGVPRTLPLDDVRLIPGLMEGVQLMQVGAVYRFVLPPKLAYGMLGLRDLGIGPNRTLQYEVELLSIIDP